MQVFAGKCLFLLFSKFKNYKEDGGIFGGKIFHIPISRCAESIGVYFNQAFNYRFDHLEKPFTPESLLNTVHAALARSGAAAPEPQELVHKTTVLRVLQRAASDTTFVSDLLYHGADALDEYELTGPEKLAILTGDIRWIERYAGKLSADQRKWLDQRQTEEIW